MILVDTHVVVWLTIEPRKLPKTTGRIVAESRAGNTLVAIADATLWELAMLTTSGRIKPAIPLGQYLRRVEQMFQVLPINRGDCGTVDAILDRLPEGPYRPVDWSYSVGAWNSAGDARQGDRAFRRS